MLDTFFADFTQWMVHGDANRVTHFLEDSDQQSTVRLYRNGHFESCINTLVSNYPSVSAVVGDDYFRTLARTYVERDPPRRHSLVGYGHAFAHHLRENETHHRLRYLSDLALLDQAWTRIFFAVEEPVLDVQFLEHHIAAGHDITNIRTQPRQTTAVIPVSFYLLDLWRELRQRRLERRIVLKEAPQTILLWRIDQRIETRVLGAGEASFLKILHQQNSLGDATEAAINAEPDFDITPTFAALIDNKILKQPET